MWPWRRAARESGGTKRDARLEMNPLRPERSFDGPEREGTTDSTTRDMPVDGGPSRCPLSRPNRPHSTSPSLIGGIAFRREWDPVGADSEGLAVPQVKMRINASTIMLASAATILCAGLLAVLVASLATGHGPPDSPPRRRQEMIPDLSACDQDMVDPKVSLATMMHCKHLEMQQAQEGQQGLSSWNMIGGRGLSYDPRQRRNLRVESGSETPWLASP